MKRLLDNLDDDLDAQYFIKFNKYMEKKPYPMDLDKFMKLEMRYYEKYKRSKNKKTTRPTSHPVEFQFVGA
ncbi:MAG: hypothetical protein KAT17_01605 [Candidatus Aminicenantes bacterium]|nr:hypothetical protein [Candidatus Aminicenantes bacterium]